MGTQSSVEPNTSPPSSVGFVMLEFTGEEDGDEDLEDTSLDSNDGDETEDCVRCVPELKEPLRSQLDLISRDWKDLQGIRRTQSYQRQHRSVQVQPCWHRTG